MPKISKHYHIDVTVRKPAVTTTIHHYSTRRIRVVPSFQIGLENTWASLTKRQQIDVAFYVRHCLFTDASRQA